MDSIFAAGFYVPYILKVPYITYFKSNLSFIHFLLFIFNYKCDKFLHHVVKARR